MNQYNASILNHCSKLNSMKEFILSLAIIGIMISINQAYAIESGPQVPNSANTISQYCSSGTCSTGTITGLTINYTHGIKHLPILYISYSQTCQAMIKNHISGCIPLGDIIKYDTSNQYVSGHFIKEGNDTIRTKPQVKNNWLYYQSKTNKTICIECTADITTMQQAQQIILQPTDFVYVDPNNNNVTKTWTSFNGRYMQGCDIATIANIPGLFNDTISYMLSGCTKTSFNGTSIHQVKQAEWSYDNPFSTLHQDAYLKSMLHGHTYNGNNTSGGNGPQDCIRHSCSYQDPYKKQGY